MPKVYSPNKRYTGVIAGVSFVNGVGETEDKWLLQWFRGKGYEVEGVEEKPKDSEDTDKDQNDGNQTEKTTDYNELTVPELREIAKEREIEGYYEMRKAELVEALAGE